MSALCHQEADIARRTRVEGLERHAVLSGIRFLAIATVLFCLGVTSTAQAGDELITAQDTVLCLRGQDVVRASDPKAARNQASLRALRCMRPRPFALFR